MKHTEYDCFGYNPPPPTVDATVPVLACNGPRGCGALVINTWEGRSKHLQFHDEVTEE